MLLPGVIEWPDFQHDGDFDTMPLRHEWSRDKEV